MFWLDPAKTGWEGKEIEWGREGEKLSERERETWLNFHLFVQFTWTWTCSFWGQQKILYEERKKKRWLEREREREWAWRGIDEDDQKKKKR